MSMPLDPTTRESLYQAIFGAPPALPHDDTLCDYCGKPDPWGFGCCESCGDALADAENQAATTAYFGDATGHDWPPDPWE